jgi:hypothetical protein
MHRFHVASPLTGPACHGACPLHGCCTLLAACGSRCAAARQAIADPARLQAAALAGAGASGARAKKRTSAQTVAAVNRAF